MRTTVLLAACLALACARPLAAAEALRRTEHVHEMGAGATCRLEHVTGHIQVRPAAARTLRLIAVVRARAATEARAQTDLGRVRVDVHQGPGVFTARSLFENETSAARPGDLAASRFEGVDVDVSYDLELPRGVKLDLATVSGQVEVRDVESVVARSVSGSIRIAQVHGALDAESVSGMLDIASASGGVRVKSVSGDVKLALSDAASGGTVQTTSGAVTVHASAAAAARVSIEARSVSGRISSALPRTGGMALRIATISGDITAAAAR